MSCKSLEKSGLGEKEIDLYNQQICTSYDQNQLGEFKCKEWDDILCQKCHKAHSRLKVTCTRGNTNLSMLFMKERTLTNVKFVTKHLRKSVIILEIHV